MPSITGNIADATDEVFPSGKLLVTLEASDAVAPGTGGGIRFLPPKTLTVDGSGNVSSTDIPATTGGAPLYRLTIEGRSGNGEKRAVRMGWFELTADRTLDWIRQNTFTPTTVTPELASQVQENADAVLAVVATNDGIMASVAADPESDFYAVQAATVAAQVDPLREFRTSDQIRAFVRKLQAAVNPAYITALGDSTGASPTGWLIELVRDKIGPAFPAYTVQSRAWDSANEKYADYPTVHQTGTAGDRGMVATGAATDKFFTVADSAATSPSTALRVEFDLKIPATGSAFTLGGKFDSATNNRGWFVQKRADDVLELFFSTDGTSGTQRTRAASAALPGIAFGSRVQIRATWLGNPGAGTETTEFYYSTNRGATWSKVGATVTTGTDAAMFDAAAVTQFVGRTGAANASGGAVVWYGMKVWTSLAASARPVIDFETGQWNGFGSLGTSSAQFTDYVGNTVQVQATGSTGAMQGAAILTLLNGCVSGQTISYANDGTRQPKLTPVASDLAVINFSHNEVGLIAYRTPYKTLTDALVAKWPDVGILAVAQNPRTSPATNVTEHAIRIDAIRALAASQRWALLDAFKVIGDAGVGTYVLSDGIHPTDAGYDLIRDEAWGLFDAFAA